MNFLAPELLLGLLLIPVAIGFYLWAQRRRSRYAVRFTNLDLLANLAPRRPSWRRHLPPVLYLGAIAALLIGLARPTMVVATPREDATVLLAMDVSGSMRATDVSPTRLDAAKASALSFIDQLPEGIRVGIVVVRVGAGHARQPDDRPQAAQGRHRRPHRPRRDGHGRRADAGPRHRREDPGGGRRDARRQRLVRAPRRHPVHRPPPTPAPSRARRPTSRRASRSSPRSSSPTGRSRSARPSRSMPPGAPRPSASRSTRSPSARPTARSRSRTTSVGWSPSTCRPTPRRWRRSPRSPAARTSTAPTAADLASVYDNLESRIGYTEERQEVTFALVGAGPPPGRPRGGPVGSLVRPPAVARGSDAADGVAVRSRPRPGARCPPSMSRRCAPSSRPSPGSTTAARSSSSTARAGPRSRSA